ncbi:potassium transporter Kup [Limimaricola sp. G21655-S1]|uniref:potassium transporter Kup n=1 Tax=Limimaricola sp. G21655-S1 TaxID=3014768 RepID=UPI0022B05422|nr:potassium transporter Kup [Limimaricola sp. G21655-S1]
MERSSSSFQQGHAEPRWKLILGSVGVVYGDIGTSPIYALREGLRASATGTRPSGDVIGLVSLLLWTLILIVTLKYVVLILRADNRGEGGTMSLFALVEQATGRRSMFLLGLGMVGTALFFGDAIITPAVSVLAAVEGMILVQPSLEGSTLPIALVILTALFWAQSLGTGRVSILFGPIMLIWFLALGCLGLAQVAAFPAVLAALNPAHGIAFIIEQGAGALPVMAAVFLAVTGAEALYADMGHFGRGPIRIAWATLILPALALTYLGQGALVMTNPEAASDPFFLMAPGWALLPLVILTTLATIIASQAVISGAYSLAHQAVQLGLLPRLRSVHTSDTQIGQIYMPRVNTLLYIGVVALVVVFQSSEALASAYGIAVTGDMIITSILAIILFRRGWKWSLPLVGLIVGPMLVVELSFLMANLTKFLDGGYLTVGVAALIVIMMWTWVRGTRIIQKKLRLTGVPLSTLIETLGRSGRLVRVPGTAVFLSADSEMAPSALLHNIKHNSVLHEQNVIISVQVEARPYVSDANRMQIEEMKNGFYRIKMTFGYAERPDVPKILKMARQAGIRFDIMSTSFFLHRRFLQVGSKREMPLWQAKLYANLVRSAAGPTSFYRLPSNRVIEIGQQISI